MFNEPQKVIVLAALEEKAKSVLRQKNSKKFPEFDVIYDKALGDIRVCIEIVRSSKSK